MISLGKWIWWFMELMGRGMRIAFYVFLGFCLFIVFGDSATYNR